MQGLAILGFDADNDLEYINYQVATSLEEMRIEFATSCKGTPTISTWQVRERVSGGDAPSRSGGASTRALTDFPGACYKGPHRRGEQRRFPPALE